MSAFYVLFVKMFIWKGLQICTWTTANTSHIILPHEWMNMPTSNWSLSITIVYPEPLMNHPDSAGLHTAYIPHLWIHPGPYTMLGALGHMRINFSIIGWQPKCCPQSKQFLSEHCINFNSLTARLFFDHRTEMLIPLNQNSSV